MELKRGDSETADVHFLMDDSNSQTLHMELNMLVPSLSVSSKEEN